MVCKYVLLSSWNVGQDEKNCIKKNTFYVTKYTYGSINVKLPILSVGGKCGVHQYILYISLAYFTAAYLT